MITNFYSVLDKRIKSTDFPLQCRGMYYFAKGRHAHQERKISGYPYYVHPRAVAYLVMKYDGSIDQINAALAHDLLEDTDTSYLEIEAVTHSQKVADLCTELRNNDHVIENLGKEEYMNQKLMQISDDALLIKLCDIYCNMADNPTEKAKLRMLVNVKYLITNRVLSKSQKRLAEDILELGEKEESNMGV